MKEVKLKTGKVVGFKASRSEVWQWMKEIGRLRKVLDGIESMAAAHPNDDEHSKFADTADKMRRELGRAQRAIDRVIMQDDKQYDDTHFYDYSRHMADASWSAMTLHGSGPFEFPAPMFLIVARNGMPNNRAICREWDSGNRALLAFSTDEKAESYRLSIPDHESYVVQNHVGFDAIYEVADSCWKNGRNLIAIDDDDSESEMTIASLCDFRHLLAGLQDLEDQPKAEEQPSWTPDGDGTEDDEEDELFDREIWWLVPKRDIAKIYIPR